MKPSSAGIACLLLAAIFSSALQTRQALAQATSTASEDEAAPVEVSLGDWELRNKLADNLKVKVSDVPLTVAVPRDLAGKVCPVSEDDLAQQQSVSPTRTCAAKTMSSELENEVQKQMRPE